jgi:tartrate-resistant acid phosphatase type 5
LRKRLLRGVARRALAAARAGSKFALRGVLRLRALRGGPVVAAPAADLAGELRFLAVGRQGYGNLRTVHIATSMERAAGESPTHAVLYLGDNFYPRGVRSISDSQWRHKFEQLYFGAHLRGMPFFAVTGNHDAEGDPAVQVQYAQNQCGSGRWRMDGPYYSRDFGDIDGRPLVRVVFLDTVALHRHPAEQVQFLREAFGPQCQSLWRLVVGHYGCRSVTREPYTRRLTLSSLIPELQQLGVDLYLSANDRFQQVLARSGEPLHVSANGGGDMAETGLAAEDPADFVASQGGFAVIELTTQTLTVELRNVTGDVSHRRQIPPRPSVGGLS